MKGRLKFYFQTTFFMRNRRLESISDNIFLAVYRTSPP
ncbi:hypothetical protein HMPREF1051_0364 [Neisseria sicca VK64]|uniref:Uncharacterized protein n=1 Tax=Neisseria sicca VK64 TaxID=1095748 RepID=I2ND00_NEISI|nr:hypothetical protein HMPREF1051_0364 [Neisseria sicca VK64]